MRIISVVGARPNFMKIAPFIRAIESYNQKLSEVVPLPNPRSPIPISHLLVHTGQHYDDRMSRKFFEELGIPDADINLEIGSGSHAEQVGLAMIALEKVFIEHQPDWVVLVGDVNATLAASVSAKKLNIKVCHIEAGLRSGDMTMPEEINRLVTDRLSDLLLTPDTLSSENLRKEGIPEEKIKFVGNIMIDTLEANREKAARLSINDIIQKNLLQTFIPQTPRPITHAQNLTPKTPFALVTLHRPSNVDNPHVIGAIIDFLTSEVTKDLMVVWPIHPRTEKQLMNFGLFSKLYDHPRVLLLHPVGYLDMLRMNMDATIMLTDSGGLQEECTILGTPCLTLRWNTERPVTLREHGGASVLVGNNIDRIRMEYQFTLTQNRKSARPELWDGNTAQRCLTALLDANK